MAQQAWGGDYGLSGAAWQAARGRDRARQYANRQFTAGLARVVKQAQARSAGMGRMALQPLAWQAWRGPSLLGMDYRGRRRKVWFSFQWKARQAALRWARIPRFPMARQARQLEAVRGFFWLGRRRMVHPVAPGMARQASQRIAGPLVDWQAVQRSARQNTARQAPHDTERSAPKAGMASLAEPTHGRQGVASLEGKQRQARPRWSANAWKERQSWRDRSVRVRCACRGRHRYFCQTAA